MLSHRDSVRALVSIVEHLEGEDKGESVNFR